MKGSKFGGNPRTFKKNRTQVGKSASHLLRNTDNLIHIFGEEKGKQMIHEHSPCCGICRFKGSFINEKGNPVYYQGDPVELSEFMSDALGPNYIFYMYQPGNFIILGTEEARKNGECTAQYFSETFGELCFDENGDIIEDCEEAHVRFSFRVGDNGELYSDPEPIFVVRRFELPCSGIFCFSDQLVDINYKYPKFEGSWVRKHPGLLYFYGLNFLDDESMIPTIAQMDAYSYNASQATSWRIQRDINLKEQNKRLIYHSIDQGQGTAYAWNDTVHGPPTMDNGDLFYSLNQGVSTNKGWTSVPRYMNGCSCNRRFQQETGAADNFPHRIRFLGYANNPGELPTTGSFEIGDAYELSGVGNVFWNPTSCITTQTCYQATTSPVGSWCFTLNCPGFLYSVRNCTAQQRASRDAYNKAMNEFVLAQHTWSWFGFFFPKYQIEKFLLP